jgi:hypothetical protein
VPAARYIPTVWRRRRGGSVACRRVASIARSMAALSIRIKRSRDQPPQRLMSVSPSALTFSR